MASNFSRFNQNGVFNFGQRPLNNNNQNPLACRLCSQVFPTIQALITHTEFHVDQENLSRGRRSFSPNFINPQRQLIPHRLQPNYPRPSILQQSRTIRRANSVVTPHSSRANNPYPYTTTRVGVAQPTRPRQLPPEIMPSSTVSYGAQMARLAARPTLYPEEIMEVSPVDGTKALINKLDRPIINNNNNNNNNNNSFINMLDMNGNNPELLALNLELRL